MELGVQAGRLRSSGEDWHNAASSANVTVSRVRPSPRPGCAEWASIAAAPVPSRITSPRRGRRRAASARRRCEAGMPGRAGALQRGVPAGRDRLTSVRLTFGTAGQPPSGHVSPAGLPAS